MRLNNGKRKDGSDGSILVIQSPINPLTGTLIKDKTKICDLMSEKDFKEYRSLGARLGFLTSRQRKGESVISGWMSKMLEGDLPIADFESATIAAHSEDVGAYWDRSNQRKRVFKSLDDVIDFYDSLLKTDVYSQEGGRYHEYRSELIAAMLVRMRELNVAITEEVTGSVNRATERLARAGGRGQRLSSALKKGRNGTRPN